MFTIDYSNKIVLVTGVSAGIGRGVAREFARAGATIVGCARKDASHPTVLAFCEEVEAFGNKAFYVKTDVTKQVELEHLVECIETKYGHLDVIVSNAGVNVFEGTAECTRDKWEYNLDLNLTSHWYLSKLCKPLLEKSSSGVILIMNSNHAYTTIPGCFPYSVTKTALLGLVRNITLEWSPKIRAVGIAPGFIDTEGNDTWFNSFSDAMVERQRTIDLHPMKCIGTPKEVGELCVYLASEKAKFISGTTILMDGGRSSIMQD